MFAKMSNVFTFVLGPVHLNSTRGVARLLQICFILTISIDTADLSNSVKFYWSKKFILVDTEAQSLKILSLATRLKTEKN